MSFFFQLVFFPLFFFQKKKKTHRSLSLSISLSLSLKQNKQMKKKKQLEGLKRLCEASLAGSLTVSGLRATYELSEAFSAPQLGRRCVLFALEKYDAVSAALEPAGFCALMRRMVPKLRESLTEQMVLRKDQQQQQQGDAAAGGGAGGGAAAAVTAVTAVAGGGGGGAA